MKGVTCNVTLGSDRGVFLRNSGWRGGHYGSHGHEYKSDGPYCPGSCEPVESWPLNTATEVLSVLSAGGSPWSWGWPEICTRVQGFCSMYTLALEICMKLCDVMEYG